VPAVDTLCWRSSELRRAALRRPLLDLADLADLVGQRGKRREYELEAAGCHLCPRL
jgi:hypothetical protein